MEIWEVQRIHGNMVATVGERDKQRKSRNFGKCGRKSGDTQGETRTTRNTRCVENLGAKITARKQGSFVGNTEQHQAHATKSKMLRATRREGGEAAKHIGKLGGRGKQETRRTCRSCAGTAGNTTKRGMTCGSRGTTRNIQINSGKHDGMRNNGGNSFVFQGNEGVVGTM